MNINKPSQNPAQKANNSKSNSEILSALDIDFNFLSLLPGFDAHEVRNWFYSAKYFIRTNEIVKNIPDENQIVTMQIFQKTPGAKIAWIDLVVNLIKLCAWEYKDSQKAQELFEKYLNLKALLQKNFESNFDENANQKQLEIYNQLLEVKKQLDSIWKLAWEKISIEKCVKEWDIADQFQAIIKIRWPYKYFARLESVYLGILARATKVATNTAKVAQAANWKPLFFFADRFDILWAQQLDWYAASLAWAAWVATDAGGSYNNIKWMWTMPHALIAVNNWDTKIATLEFAKKYPDVPSISLVDFDNNCAQTSVEVAQYLKQNGEKLYWVRLDTSGSMVDEWILFGKWILEEYFSSDDSQQIRQEYQENKSANNVVNNSLFSWETISKLKEKSLCWVSARLVKLVRENLDDNWFNQVKIFVSGWFNAEKIELFENENIPVDWYWVWSSLLAPKYVKDNWDFTADIVSINWNIVGKVWRKEY